LKQSLPPSTADIASFPCQALLTALHSACALNSSPFSLPRHAAKLISPIQLSRLGSAICLSLHQSIAFRGPYLFALAAQSHSHTPALYF
jgi:hypothetical protein